jgi:hypothetical protein
MTDPRDAAGLGDAAERDPAQAWDHPEADLIFLEVIGRLDEARRQHVEQLAAQDPTFRRHLEFARWLRQQVQDHPGVMFADHTPSDELVAWCDDPASLLSARAQRIEEHLVVCAACAAEVEIVRAVNADLARTSSVRATAIDAQDSAGWPSRWWARLAALRTLPPAPAYVALLVLLIPAIVGVRSWLSPGGPEGTAPPGTLPLGTAPPGTPPSGTSPAASVPPAAAAGAGALMALRAPVVLEAASARGVSAPVELSVSGAGEQVTLLVHAPISVEPGIRYDARLLGPAGQTLLRAEGLQSLDEFGTFAFVLRPTALAPGDYELTVDEVASATGQVRASFQATFRLRP